MSKLKLLNFLITLFFSSLAWAQTNVQGILTDDSGEPLIGVTVQVLGTTIGTITDIDGKYSLSAPTDAVLVFSYIGFESQTASVDGRTQIDIILDDDVQQLEEVVVSALGFKQNKDELGSTSSSINAADMQRSGEAGFAASLAGKASNIIVNSSNGDPGAGTTIRIRGANSISGTTSPLIILDGVPISNSTYSGSGGNSLTGGTEGGTSAQSRLNDLNQSDIESVTVLKGASAASLWGSRAANGVIVITTKSGASGKMKISYKLTSSWDKVHERLEMQNTYGQGIDGNQSESDGESWGDYIPDRSGGSNTVDEDAGYFTSKDGTVIHYIEEKNSKDTFLEENWDAVFQTGGYTQHDLSVSGGNDNATFFLGIGRLDQKGIIRNSDYDRTNLRLNSYFALADWLSVSSKSSFISSSSNRIQQSSNTAGLLLGLLRQAPDFDSRDYIGTHTNSFGQIFNNRHRAYRDQEGKNLAPSYNNPLWTIFEQTANSDVERFTMSNQFDITPNDWLHFIVRGGVDAYTDTRVYFFPIHSAGSRQAGQYAEDILTEREYNLDLIGKANFKLSDQISLHSTVGFNINDRNRNFNTSIVSGFLANVRKQTADLNSDNASSEFDNSKRLIRSNRGYVVLSFDLFDQLNVTTSGAVEAASSIIGSTFYPSIDAAWRLSEVVNLSSTPVSFAKLRASWGKVGVQPLAHRFETTAEGGFDYTSYSSELAIALHGGGFRLNDDLGNPDLKPEIKTEWEIGTDLRFFNDRTSLTATYYYNEIDDILINLALTPSFGFDTQYANAAKMRNKGIELEMEHQILDQNDLKISASLNWARNRNKVLNLFGTETIDLSGGSVSSRAIVDKPLGVFYGSGSLKNEDGSFILDDNGFPQLTGEQEVLGNPNPDWRGGLGINIGWKNFGLNALFEHSHGGDFSPRTQWVLNRFGTTQETANTLTLDADITNYDGDVIAAGTRVRGNIKNFGGGDVLLDETWYRHGIGGGFGDSQAYNFSIKSAQFTRLRELSLSYAMNSAGFREKTKLGSVIFTLSGRNLFLWDKLQGVDPQVNQTGVGNAAGLDYFTNPSTKSYLFSVAINF